MGFIITESVDFPKLGISSAGCYVTIRGSYSQYKNGVTGMFPPMLSPSSAPYRLYVRYYIYAAHDLELTPLKEEYIGFDCEESVTDPIDYIYQKIKDMFAGKTFTDV